MKNLIIAAALAASLLLSACNTSLQEVARDGIASAYGYTQSVKANHPECATGTQSTTCTILAKTIAAKDSTIDALEVYCTGAAFNAGTGPCVPPSGPALQTATAALNAALGNLNQEIKDIKAIK